MDQEAGNCNEFFQHSGTSGSGRRAGGALLRQRRNDGRWDDIVLAYKTLGVVFGGLVTSPLYVYPSMNLESPTEEDYLGIYSIMFWTITLFGVVKYICIALNADDHGEGGTFALYSLLCRHINIGIPQTKIIDSKRNILNSDGPAIVETKSKLGKFLEKSVAAQRMLLFMAMAGVSMLIGDGILTPPISVLSAIDGLKGPFPSLSKAAMEALSVAVIISLFLVQKHGTSRVSFLFSPIMGAWTLTTPIIGVYSLVAYYPSIFKAFSPHYIVHFFLRNKRKGWQLLGGTVLSITGVEATFADLGHFNKRSIQMAFLFTIYPSMILTLAGQTAYLIRNPNDHNDGFYKFVPDRVYWPMFIISTLAAIVASQSLISATFSVIKQAVLLDYFPRIKVVHTSQQTEGEVYSPETNYILMVLCVMVILYFGDGKDIGNAFGVVVILVMLITTILLTIVMVTIWNTPLILVMLYVVPFFILEGVYASAIFTKVLKGGWFPFVVSVLLSFIMFGWYYGRQKKLQYELTNKITVDTLNELLLMTQIRKVPGLCFFYSKVEDGITPVFQHYLKNFQVLHTATIVISLRPRLVANVNPYDMISIRKLRTGLYGCTLQYGYSDSITVEGNDFINQVKTRIQQHIRMKFEEIGADSVEEELTELEKAREAGVVHVRGKSSFHLSNETVLFDKILLGFYEFLHRNCRSSLPAMGSSIHQRVEIGMLYKP